MRTRIAVVVGVALAAMLALFGVTASASNATPAAPTALTCSGTYSNVTVSAVTVPAWASCIITNSTVTGSVTVNPTAEFDACNDYIGGSVNATQAYTNIDNKTSIAGSLNLNKPGATISIGGSPCTEKGPSAYSAYVCPYYVGGSINVLNAPWSNYLWVSIGDCGDVSVHGSVTIQGNRQYVEIEDATIVGALLCINNWPPAQAYDVTVGGAHVGCPTQNMT
jgi:hypothetical protein